MSESHFGRNAGVEGEEASYDADVRAGYDSDDDAPASDVPLSGVGDDDPIQTSRAADEAAAYEASAQGEVSPIDEDGPGD